MCSALAFSGSVLLLVLFSSTNGEKYILIINVGSYSMWSPS